MKNYVKTILYWSSLLCPLVDIFKGIVSGVSKSLETASEDIERLKKIEREKIVAHKSVLNQEKFEKDN